MRHVTGIAVEGDCDTSSRTISSPGPVRLRPLPFNSAAQPLRLPSALQSPSITPPPPPCGAVSRSQAPGLASSGHSEHQQRRAPEVEALGWPSVLTPRPAVPGNTRH
ncbi:unnamed protein product [Boreogadus saida]